MADLNTDALCSLGLAEAAEKLRAREISSVDLTNAHLARIKRTNGTLNAYLVVDEARALQAAGESDTRLAQGGPAVRPLEGCPLALKDNFVTKGDTPTSAASKILEGFVSPYEGTPSGRLKGAGAVVLGKLNMDEFAMGSSGENSSRGQTRNPYDLTRTPGGSSSGSAAAVAARLALGALGTDTGGSIRQPAAFCGLVGLKPTYGRVSRYGVIAFASSLDQVGPLTRTVRDNALLLGVIAGHDPQDSTSAPLPVPDYTALLGRDIKGLRLGLPREYLGEGLSPEVRAAFEKVCREYESLGAQLVEISLPHTDYAIACYYIIAPAECSSNLARYDGVRYGARSQTARDTNELYVQSRSQGFGPEVKRRIMLGTYCLSAGYYDAYYLKAQKVRTLIRRDFTRAYERVDAILTPTTPGTAFKIGERADDPLAMYLADIFTVSANLAGLPALAIPAGFDSQGLPIGVQLIGGAFTEAQLYQLAFAYEATAPHHTKGPEV